VLARRCLSRFLFFLVIQQQRRPAVEAAAAGDAGAPAVAEKLGQQTGTKNVRRRWLSSLGILLLGGLA
jgi:hypothetical protein